MKKLIAIIILAIITPPVFASAWERDIGYLERELDDIKRELRLERERRRIELEEQKRQEEKRHQEQAIENEKRRQEYQEIRDHQRRQQIAIEIEREVEAEKRRVEAEEARFEWLRDMASQHPDSKYSELYEIELLRRSGEISNHQARIRTNYIIRGPGGEVGEKRGGRIIISEEITDPSMKARGVKKGDTFVDE